MRKIFLPLLALIGTFWILFLIFWQNIIPKYIFEIITGEKTRLILPGSLGGLYIYGTILAAILVAWKVTKLLDPKIKNSVKVFRITVRQLPLFLIAICTMLISFNQFYFFTDAGIYRANLILSPGITYVAYKDIQSTLVDVEFRLTSRANSKCQTYVNFGITSEILTIERKSITVSQMYDIGTIFREKRIPSNVIYTSLCGSIPKDQQTNIENTFDVKL